MLVVAHVTCTHLHTCGTIVYIVYNLFQDVVHVPVAYMLYCACHMCIHGLHVLSYVHVTCMYMFHACDVHVTCMCICVCCSMDGFRVVKLDDVLSLLDILITATGERISGRGIPPPTGCQISGGYILLACVHSVAVTITVRC